MALNLFIYLLKYSQGGNAKPEDLLKAFQSAYDAETTKPNLNEKNVKDLFENWHLSAGYPVLTVQNIEKAKYNFTQVCSCIREQVFFIRLDF